MTPKATLSKNHQRRHSWPPFRVQALHPLKDMDENPFSFFVSAPDEPYTTENDSLSAGIERVPRSRSLSPFAAVGENRNNLTLFAAPTAVEKLKRWIVKMERRYLRHNHFSPLDVPQNSPCLYLAESSGSPHTRGRGSLRGSPRSVRSRDSRSHSGRPRVWREPGEGIWPVLEEQEEVGLGILM